MSQTVSILIPIEITEAMATAFSGVSEPDAARGEVEWSAAAYTEGDSRIRSATHKLYTCTKTMAASRSVAPESDPLYWKEMKPTNKWAAFDGTSNTQALGTTSMSFTVVPGFFNAIACYGLEGASLSLTVKDSPGGNVVYGPTSFNIQQVPFDEYDYCWGQIRQLDKLVIASLVPYPTAEATITISAASGDEVAAGIIAFGDLASLVPQDPTWPGPNVGAEAKPTTFSDIDVLFDGTVKIINRRSGTDLTMELTMPKGAGDTAAVILQQVLDTPAAIIGTTAAGFAALNTFGIISGRVVFDDANDIARLDARGIA